MKILILRTKNKNGIDIYLKEYEKIYNSICEKIDVKYVNMPINEFEKPQNIKIDNDYDIILDNTFFKINILPGNYKKIKIIHHFREYEMDYTEYDGLIFLNKCSYDSYKYKDKIKKYLILEHYKDRERIIKLANKQIKNLPNKYNLFVGNNYRNEEILPVIEMYINFEIKTPLLILGDLFNEFYFNLNKDNNIHFLGYKKNPYPYIKNANIIFHPSLGDTSSNLLLEASILNTPVICNEINCLPENIIPDYAIIKKEEQEILSISLFRYYNNIDLKNYKFLENDKNFNFEYQKKSLEKFFEKVLNEN